MAPDLATTRRIFNWAEKYRTPMFSSSALRFAQELEDAQARLAKSKLEFVAIGGGGNHFASYAVHQAEMLVALADRPAVRVKRIGTPHAPMLLVDFGEGLQASLQMIPGAPFRFSAVTVDAQTCHCAQMSGAFFQRFIQRVLEFFSTREAPFPSWQTEAIVALLDAAATGKERPDAWVPVESVEICQGDVPCV